METGSLFGHSISPHVSCWRALEGVVFGVDGGNGHIELEDKLAVLPREVTLSRRRLTDGQHISSAGPVPSRVVRNYAGRFPFLHSIVRRRRARMTFAR